MAELENMEELLRESGADEIDIADFVNFCDLFRGRGKVGRYEVYRLWARCLRHRRTPFSPGGKFTFPETLLVYMRHISAGDIVDADPPQGAVVITPTQFVQYVVKHIDDAF